MMHQEIKVETDLTQGWETLSSGVRVRIYKDGSFEVDRVDGKWTMDVFAKVIQETTEYVAKFKTI